MPYLNWKDASPGSVSQEIAPAGSYGALGGDHKWLLKLSLGATELQSLKAMLQEVLSEGARGELRLDLPRGWIIFWKLRDAESRLLVAHPEQEEWVATASLEASHGAMLLTRLQTLGAGQVLRVGELGSVGSVSNVEIELVHF